MKEFQFHEGQGTEPELDTHGLWSLNLHCVKNHHSSIADTTTRARDYFRKPLSSTTTWSYIHKSHLKLWSKKEAQYLPCLSTGGHQCLWTQRRLGWATAWWKCELLSDKSVSQISFTRNWNCILQTTKRTIQTIINKSKIQMMA